MKKHLVAAVVAMTAALGLLACSHDKTKEEGLAAPAPAPTTTSSTDTTSTADVAAAEATPAPAPDTSAQQTQDYEKSSRK